jgi:hypothetical protein
MGLIALLVVILLMLKVLGDISKVKPGSLAEAPEEYLHLFSSDIQGGIKHYQTQTSKILHPTATLLYRDFGIIVHCITDSFETLKNNLSLKANKRFNAYGEYYGAGIYNIDYKHNYDTTSKIQSLCIVTKSDSRIEFQNDTICYIPFSLADAYISYNCSDKKDFYLENRTTIFDSKKETIVYLVLLIKNKKLYSIVISPDKEKPSKQSIESLIAK